MKKWGLLFILLGCLLISDAAAGQTKLAISDLGTLGRGYSEATGINDLGQVVGSTGTSSGFAQAFLWTAKDGMKDLYAPNEGYTRAYAINEAGQTVGLAWGYCWHWACSEEAALWNPTGDLIDLGTSGAAYDINNLGQVVGSYDGNAFLWTESDGLHDLGAPNGIDEAHGINDLG